MQPEYEFKLPRELIVIQVVFGKPLRHLELLRGADIDELVGQHLGRGNYHKVVMKLVEIGWLAGVQSRQLARGGSGRPSTVAYRRTHKGLQEYAELAKKLKPYGIHLLK